MDEAVDNVSTGRAVKNGPRFPRFRWSKRVSSASIVVVDKPEIASIFIPEFLNSLWARALNERDIAVGFDVEWKPNRGGSVNPIAVMQFASTGHVLVVHLSKWKESSPEGDMGDGMVALRLLLEIPQIKKVGVTLLDDALKVWRDYRISMRGCVELNDMVKRVDPEGFYSVPQHPIGLAKLAEMYLHRHLEKDQLVRTSNWENTMSAEQLTYAADDAVCSLAIFHEMKIRLTPAQYEDSTGEFDVIEGSKVNLTD